MRYAPRKSHIIIQPILTVLLPFPAKLSYLQQFIVKPT